jgi:AcrR family transcriptional regulator
MPQSRGSPPRRDRLLRVAEALFARRGYAGVGLREIARGAGIRASSLFKHFPGKRELYNQALQGLFVDMLRMIREASRGEGSYEERLRGVVHGYIDFVLAHPTFPSMFFRVMLDHPRGVNRSTQNLGYEIYRTLEEFLMAGRRAGAFRNVSPRHFWLGFTGAIAAFHGLLPVTERLDPIDLLSSREKRRWKTEVWDMVSRFVLKAAAGEHARRRRRAA